MIVCRSCGSHNADGDAFCGSCGEFLEWTGEKIGAPTASPPTVEPAPAAAEPKPVVPAPKPPIQPALRPAERKPQPQEMLPQAPVRRRPSAPTVSSPPTRQPQPDDLICGMCGEGNPPTRRFCSRCGESLQTATVVPTPWWRQVLRLFERRPRPAGSRPTRRSRLLTPRGVLAAVRRVLIVALLLLGLLYAVFPSMRSLVNGLVLDGKDKIESMFVQQYVPVRPIQVTATGEVPDHLAPLATDGFSNTFWAAPDAAAQPALVLEFDRPTSLVRAIVHNGGGEDFQALSRPRELHLVYSDGERTIGTSDVLLTDTPDEQQVEFTGGDGATRVEIHVMSVYSSVDSPGLALSEIELFERQ